MIYKKEQKSIETHIHSQSVLNFSIVFSYSLSYTIYIINIKFNVSISSIKILINIQISSPHSIFPPRLFFYSMIKKFVIIFYAFINIIFYCIYIRFTHFCVTQLCSSGHMRSLSLTTSNSAPTLVKLKPEYPSSPLLSVSRHFST